MGWGATKYSVDDVLLGFCSGAAVVRTASLRTDMKWLYSYDVPIACHLAPGHIWVSTQKLSKTTSKHCTLVERKATRGNLTVHRAEKLEDLCTNCWMLRNEHADQKCLYEPTVFAAA